MLKIPVPVSLLVAHDINPLKKKTWAGVEDKILFQEIDRALRQNQLIAPWNIVRSECQRDDHIRRIAWLVINQDTAAGTNPISLTVLLNRKWLCTDGHHRLAAALYRGDSSIEAMVRGQGLEEFLDAVQTTQLA